MSKTEKREVMNTMNIKNTMHTKDKKHAKDIKSYRMIAMSLLSFFAVILAFSLTSCTEDADETDSLVDATHATLRFTVNTRSIADDPEQGSIDENVLSTYRIYFFDNNNKYIATFDPTQFSPSDDMSTYTISGKIEDSVVNTLEVTNNGNFKIVMLANWPEANYPSDDVLTTNNASIDDVCTGSNSSGTTIGTPTFDCPESPASGDPDETPVLTIPEDGIPFYGVHTYESQTFEKGKITTLESPIYLLRAMAKVEVVDVTKGTRESSPYYSTIKSAKICRYNAKGYCAPEGIDEQSKYESVDNGYYVNAVHLPYTDNGNSTDNEESEDFPTLAMYHDEDDDTWVAYIPEYKNTITTGTYQYPCYIELELECNDDDTDNTYNYDNVLEENGYDKVKIYFAEDGESSDETEYYDVQRNKLYRFNVTLPLIKEIQADNGVKGQFWFIKRK